MSAINTSTWSPSSFQLRLAFTPRRFPLNLDRVRVRKLDRWVRVSSVSGDNSQQKPQGDTWAIPSSSADTFSGWSASGGAEEPSEPEKKSFPGGIVGAGVAGFVLVAGLAFATLSISKRSNSKAIQEMEPLMRQQETVLAADDQNDRVEQDENERKDPPHDDGGLTTTGIDNDSSLRTEINEAANRNTQSGSDLDSTFSNGNSNTNATSEDGLKNESAIDSMLVATHAGNGTKSEIDNGSFMAPNIENSDDSLVIEKLESPTELEEYLTDATPDLSPHQEGVPAAPLTEISGFSAPLPFNSSVNIPPEPLDDSDKSPLPVVLEPLNSLEENAVLASTQEDFIPDEENVLPGENMVSAEKDLNGDESLGKPSVLAVDLSSLNEQDISTYNNSNESNESTNPGTSFSSAGIPAPSVVSAALQVVPGKVLVPAVVDQVQAQALLALQVLKVIEGEVQPGDLCTRREYARWLLSASSTLSRNTASKVYPAMHIENVTELAFDDITPEDPDFPSIQGLAEAGLISSKLSLKDLSSHIEDPSSLSFFPESPLSRQDLVTWKMALEKRQLPEADKKVLHQISGFLDIDKINPDAWPALVADLSAGENGITALAFGFTRLFQPEKPVTKAQAAIALATGEASDMVSEELARIEAESMAEKAVAAHTALVAQVERDVNASFEKELLLEREKVNTIERLSEEARKELERLREEREKDGIALMKERAAVESEMEVLSRLRHEVEEQMESLMSNKVEVTFEKERLSKLLKEAEFENQEIARLQHELEIERKALSMARAWAEDEAKRAREQAKVLEVARDNWEKHGIKVVVDNELREEENVGVTWLDASKQFSVDETINRAENLADKLKALAADVRGKAKITISRILEKIHSWILVLKEWASMVTQRGLELKDTSLSKMGSSLQQFQQISAEYTLSIKEGAKRVAEDCKESVERLTQKFKT